MILLISIGLSFAVALLTGGRLSAWPRTRIRLGWLTFVALAMQIITVSVTGSQPAVRALMVASYAMLGLVVAVNWRLPGMLLMGLGMAANLAVIVANGGYMPVTQEAVSRAGLEHLLTSTEAGVTLLGSKDIVLTAADTRLWLLSDVLVIKRPMASVLSAGDVALAAGAFWFIQASLHPVKATALPKRSELPGD